MTSNGVNKFPTLVGLFVIIALGGLAARSNVPKTALTSAENHEHVIELHEEGFYPEEIVIAKGDTLTFVTKRDAPFWPASNVHPTHAIYSEFDSKREIAPGESWNFAFEKIGTWRYHDHSAPYYTGTIVVVEELFGHHHDTFADIDCDNLNDLPRGQKEKCWDKVLGDAVKTGGTVAALQKFKEMYASDRDFAESGCHWYAHRIGEEAYAEKSDDWIKNLPQEVSYCGYGFVHGFLEHGFREERNIKRAQALCNYLDENLSEKLPRIRLNCYHAIGHGFVDDPPPQKIWGDPNAIIENALKTCENVSNVPLEIRECFDGAFNTLVIFMQTGQYELESDTEDPLGFCKGTPEKYQQSCYYEFAQVLDVAGERDLAKIAEFVKDIKEGSIAGMVINTAVAGMIQGDVFKTDFTEYLRGCREINERLRLQ